MIVSPNMPLADFIEQNVEAILSEWESFAASLMPAAGGMDAAALRDHAEQILRAIAQDLRTVQSRAAQAAKSRGEAIQQPGAPQTAAQTHALVRAAEGFTIRQLVAEYRALRASVLRLWIDAYPATQEALEDIGRFNEAIDQAIAESVDFFAAEVDRWRHVFLGVLGHDLRGPLNAIILTSQLLSRREGAPLDEHTSRLMRSGERMKELLDDLLDYSRTSLGLGIHLSPQSCDLGAACRDEIDLLRAAFPRASIAFETVGPTHGVWDLSRVRQIVGNLVSNAVKYGNQPGTIRVSLRGGQEDVILSVENEGATLPGKTLQSLFEPLQRPLVEGKDEATSLGLGLFIVRQIALAHGGRVSAMSADGRTTFTVTLPRKEPL